MTARLVRCLVQLRFALSEACCMNVALVPSLIAHAFPSHGPRRDFTCGAKDVPPSRTDEHAAFGNVAGNMTFGTSEKHGSVRRFMQIIVNKNIFKTNGIGNMHI